MENWVAATSCLSRWERWLAVRRDGEDLYVPANFVTLSFICSAFTLSVKNQRFLTAFFNVCLPPASIRLKDSLRSATLPSGEPSVSKNHPAQQCPSLLLEEKVSPVHTLVTDVVEKVTISPAVWYKTQHFAAHHISQKSVPKCRFLPASPQGEAFFSVNLLF